MSKEDVLKEKVLGDNAYEKRNFPAAISHYENAISFNPSDMVLHSNLAAAYFETKELEKCVRSCETALDVGRKNGTDPKIKEKVMRRLGTAHRKMGNLEAARDVLEKAIAEYDTLEVKVALAQVKKKIYEKDDAIEKQNYAEKLGKEMDHSDRKRKKNSGDKNVIRFQVLGGGSCTECTCGNAKNIKIPTKGFGSRKDPIPYVELGDVERAVSMMLHVDELVVPEDRKSINVVFDYPLKEKFEFELESPSGKGFTRGELVTAIGNRYKKIYEEEEETSKVPVESLYNLMNRNDTDGKYGIGGHDLEDLSLEEVIFCPEENRYYLNIGS